MSNSLKKLLNNFSNKNLDEIEELVELKLKLHKNFEKYGQNVDVGDYTYGDFEFMEWDNKTKLCIGKFCSIAKGVVFVGGGEHRIDFISTYPFNILLKNFNYIKGHPHTKGDILVGNDVWIGSDAKILSGVRIGDGAVIGANSVVTKDVPAYAVVAGNPANFIKFRFDKKIIEELLRIEWWNFDEETLIEIIPLLQSNNIQELIDKY